MKNIRLAAAAFLGTAAATAGEAAAVPARAVAGPPGLSLSPSSMSAPRPKRTGVLRLARVDWEKPFRESPEIGAGVRLSAIDFTKQSPPKLVVAVTVLRTDRGSGGKTRSEIWIADLSGGAPPKRLVAAPAGRALSDVLPSPDGARIAYVTSPDGPTPGGAASPAPPELRVVEIGTGRTRRVADVEPPPALLPGLEEFDRMRWSPDGRGLYHWRRTVRPSPGEANKQEVVLERVVVGLDSGGRPRVEETDLVLPGVPSPDGRLWVSLRGADLVVEPAGAGGTTDTPRSRFPLPGGGGNVQLESAEWSGDGRWVWARLRAGYYNDGQLHVVAFRASGAAGAVTIVDEALAAVTPFGAAVSARDRANGWAYVQGRGAAWMPGPAGGRHRLLVQVRYHFVPNDLLVPTREEPLPKPEHRWFLYDADAHAFADVEGVPQSPDLSNRVRWSADGRHVLIGPETFGDLFAVRP